MFGFGGFVLALVVLIMLMVARGRSKRRIRAANPYVPQYAAPAWSGGPTGYPQYPQYPPGGVPACAASGRLPTGRASRRWLRSASGSSPRRTAPGPAG